MNKIYTKEEISAQRIIDNAEREEAWAALAEEAGGGEGGKAIADAFRTLYTMYSPDLAKWYAGLYDPGVGGYYSTESGRDYESFAPDLECTMQSMAFIRQSGLIDKVGPLDVAIPKEMQRAMVRFTKSCQSENGFFYHPHWSVEDMDLSISRRGRDLGWATQILATFGSAPTYDTPNGKVGDGLDADGNPVAQKKKEASEKQSADTTPPPRKYAAYLENKETFLEYLSEVDLVNKSYHWGNMFNSTIGQIRARAKELIAEGADYDLVQILIDWFNERIYPETGYWGHEVNMAGANGFFKIIAVYNSVGKYYPASVNGMESVLESILGDEVDKDNCCSVFNLWSCISIIKKNVSQYGDEQTREQVLSRIDEVLKEKGAEAILNSYNKMKHFQKGIGFSHFYYGTGGAQQGAYTGLTTLFLPEGEGNVDATGICSTGLTRVMFEAFGFKRVPIFGLADWMEYLNIINTAVPVVKKYPQTPYRKLCDKKNHKFITPVGGAVCTPTDCALDVTLSGAGAGIDIERTARICKGEFVKFESEISLSEIKEGGTLRFALRKGKHQDGTPIAIYADFKISENRLSVSCKKWDFGFERQLSLPDTLKVKIEYYLDMKPRKDKRDRKSTAERVYLNGELLGVAVNNDGTDPLFPSGAPNHTCGNVLIYTPDTLKATLSVKDIYFSYPN